MNDEQLTIFRRRNIGFIFQNYNLVPILNVHENIILPVELDGDTVDQKFMADVVSVFLFNPAIFSFWSVLWCCRRRKIPSTVFIALLAIPVFNPPLIFPPLKLSRI